MFLESHNEIQSKIKKMQDHLFENNLIEVMNTNYA
jgi:hypothetical protein